MNTQKLEVWKNFFVIEGLDGSGTTTQLKNVESYAASIGHSLWATWEPTDNPQGLLIRKALRKEITVLPETLARMYSTDRFEHLYGSNGIKERIETGELVFSDRYFFSSLAYQTLSSDFETILSLNCFPLPEALIFIDIPWQVCEARRKVRDEKEELFDGKSIQQRISDNYERALSHFSDKGMVIHRIDGTLTVEEIFQKIKDIIFPSK